MTLYEFATQPGPIDMRPFDECERNACRETDYCEHAAVCANLRENRYLAAPHWKGDEPSCLFYLLNKGPEDLPRLTENEFRMFCLFVHFAAQE
jgi:hypothetical protein